MGELGLAGAVRGKVKRTTISDQRRPSHTTWCTGTSGRSRRTGFGLRLHVCPTWLRARSPATAQQRRLPGLPRRQQRARRHQRTVVREAPLTPVVAGVTAPGQPNNPASDETNLGTFTRNEGSNVDHLAVAVGFEPTVVLPTHAFEACSFGRSDTPPSDRLQDAPRAPDGEEGLQ